MDLAHVWVLTSTIFVNLAQATPLLTQHQNSACWIALWILTTTLRTRHVYVWMDFMWSVKVVEYALQTRFMIFPQDLASKEFSVQDSMRFTSKVCAFVMLGITGLRQIVRHVLKGISTMKLFLTVSHHALWTKCTILQLSLANVTKFLDFTKLTKLVKCAIMELFTIGQL